MKARTEQLLVGAAMGASVGMAIGVVFGVPFTGMIAGMAVGLTYNLFWPLEGLREGTMPFSLAATNFGLLEHKGEVYLDDEYLVFELKSLLAGVESKAQRVVKIEPHTLESVWLDKGGLLDTLCIKPKTGDVLLAVPGNHGEALRLKYIQTLPGPERAPGCVASAEIAGAGC